MTLNLTNERIRALIPNVIHEAKGEMSLCDKLKPWLEDSEAWIRDNFLGEMEIPESIFSLVERIVVNKAFCEAIPSLDLSLTPAGFSVINTDGRAPASKERVERLIVTLTSTVEDALYRLVVSLHNFEEWRTSEIGKWWLATFIPNLNEVPRFRGQSDLLTAYRTMRSHALRFEQEIEELYLGSVLGSLRDRQYIHSDLSTLITMIRQAEIRYIGFHMRDQKAKCPDEHEVWHLVRPIMERLKYFPELHQQWQAEMGSRFNPEPYKNDIKGGFYF